MRLPSTRRRSPAGSSNSCTIKLAPWAAVLCVLTTACLLIAVLHSSSSNASTWRPSRRLQALSLLPQRNVHSRAFNGHHDAGERIASLYHAELAEYFKATLKPNATSADKLLATLKDLEDMGITTVALSTPWDWFNPEHGRLRFDYLSWMTGRVCQTTRMKVALILDMARAPSWVFDKWPNAKAVDSHGRQYPLLSWFHVEANQVALQVLGDVVSHLVAAQPGCVTSVQPVYNNEYEAKYTQEHDCFQDYSPPAIAAFREWVRGRRQQLPDLNARWGSSFASWDQVMPPALEAGSFLGVDATPRYWDFLKFRELYGASVLNRACATVRSAGVKCFHLIPNLFSALNAVYGVGMFKHIAASQDLDFIVLGSNFRSSYGTRMDATKIRLDVAAARSYGKPVYFQATVDPAALATANSNDSNAVQASTDLIAASFHAAWRGGAEGLGLVNWLGAHLQQQQQQQNAASPQSTTSSSSSSSSSSVAGAGAAASSSSLLAAAAGAMKAVEDPKAAAAAAAAAAGGSGCRLLASSRELVGVFLHLDSISALHGLQWGWARKDPVHDFVQDLAETYAGSCEADVAVFLELDRLLTALPVLDRVVFVEPVVLYGRAELETYALVKAAIQEMQHEVLQLPLNQTNGVQLTVLQHL
ncbi:hypothetical protein Agub_g8324 [Astrephomene gubernaculifera]|uniref:Glycoside hydrolase family 42 N-terminal domain-containing protein n=1 Tax=Astrephomene gubernaculifera TaxID=47775 RepID=A0AAD3DT78_9CHLO|nr:hypothetical protein Agub_g8324 [Astrephomene gubernaculifera]